MLANEHPEQCGRYQAQDDRDGAQCSDAALPGRFSLFACPFQLAGVIGMNCKLFLLV